MLRQTGVMVLHEDPQTGEVCVAAGSLKADWYRNLQAEPAPEVALAGRRFRPVQRFVPPEELAAHIAWARRHSPLQAWVQSRFFGRRSAIPGGRPSAVSCSPGGAPRATGILAITISPCSPLELAVRPCYTCGTVKA